MSSRQQEKERRRAERLAAEAEAGAAQARKRRLLMALGALLGIAAIVGVVIAVAGGGSSSDGSNGPDATATGAAIPAVRNRDLTSAAKAAGCTLRSPAIEGRAHVTTPVQYKTNPPTSGDHNPEPALDGIYAPGTSPTKEHFVHTLEHGRIEIQYKPGTSTRRISQLETLASEPLFGKDGYKVLLFENNTGMPYAVAATAWGQMLTCKTFTDETFDAIRAFRVKYVDKGPEVVPPTN
jgi:hypothetical protein